MPKYGRGNLSNKSCTEPTRFSQSKLCHALYHGHGTVPNGNLLCAMVFLGTAVMGKDWAPVTGIISSGESWTKIGMELIFQHLTDLTIQNGDFAGDKDQTWEEHGWTGFQKRYPVFKRCSTCKSSESIGFYWYVLSSPSHSTCRSPVAHALL
jgi:hypothetical protein